MDSGEILLKLDKIQLEIEDIKLQLKSESRLLSEDINYWENASVEDTFNFLTKNKL